jgi:hypothetical protein
LKTGSDATLEGERNLRTIALLFPTTKLCMTGLVFSKCLGAKLNDAAQPSALKKCAFMLVLIGIVPALVLVAEFAGRGILALEIGAVGKSYGLYVADPILGHIPAGNRYNHLITLNNAGFRNDEDVITPKPETALRVIAYGGSTTFSYNLPTSQTWPRQLEHLMRDRLGNSHHQVLNAGVVLWSLGHAYERARREIPTLRPDYVLIYSGINEEANALYLERAGENIRSLVDSGHYGEVSRNYPASQWLHLNSLMYKVFVKIALPLLKNYLAGTVPPLPYQLRLSKTVPDGEIAPEPDPYILMNYRVVLRRFIYLIKENGGTPVFIIQATSDRGTANNRRARYSELAAEDARRLGARVIDAREVLSEHGGEATELFSESGIHYSQLGSKLFAQKVSSKLFLAAPD